MKCKLEDIVDVTMGQSPKSEYYNTEGKGYPFLQGNRNHYLTAIDHMFRASDYLVSPLNTPDK